MDSACKRQFVFFTGMRSEIPLTAAGQLRGQKTVHFSWIPEESYKLDAPHVRLNRC